MNPDVDQKKVARDEMIRQLSKHSHQRAIEYIFLLEAMAGMKNVETARNEVFKP